jgi:hypothetical protein
MEEPKKQNIDEIIKDNQNKEENKPEEKKIDIYKKIKEYEDMDMYIDHGFPFQHNMLI